VSALPSAWVDPTFGMHHGLRPLGRSFHINAPSKLPARFQRSSTSVSLLCRFRALSLFFVLCYSSSCQWLPRSKLGEAYAASDDIQADISISPNALHTLHRRGSINKHFDRINSHQNRLHRHQRQLDNRHKAKHATQNLIDYHQEELDNCGWWLHICAHHAYQLRKHKKKLASHRQAIQNHNVRIEHHQERLAHHTKKLRKKLDDAGFHVQGAPDEDDEDDPDQPYSDSETRKGLEYSDPYQGNQDTKMPEPEIYGGRSPGF
jgi:hypothetical protein